jgi:hypothetical protein
MRERPYVIRARGLLGVRDGIVRGHFDAASANPREVDCPQLRREQLTYVRGLLRCIAVTESHYVFIFHQRAATLNVRQDVGTTARDEREVHGRRFAVRVRVRVIEISVTIHIQQSEATMSLECQQVAEQDRPVSSEHHGKLAAVHDISDGVLQRS